MTNGFPYRTILISPIQKNIRIRSFIIERAGCMYYHEAQSAHCSDIMTKLPIKAKIY